LSPNIRIDDDVYNYLQRRARAFVDTPNSVLRRLLGLDTQTAEAELLKEDVGRRSRKTTQAAGRRRRKGRKAVAKGRPQNATKATGMILPAEIYDIPLLASLAERGGTAPAREVIEAVGKKLDGKLTSLDRERLASGGVRWENRVQFVRLRLVEQGLLSKNSPRGTWSLTDAGRARLSRG
jgi:Mrr restriction endonuclease-like protein